MRGFHAPWHMALVAWGCILLGAAPGRGEPAPVTTGLQLWLRADSNLTFNGSRISAWGDMSGNSNNVSQATAGQQPLHTASWTNGQPALYFQESRVDLLNNTVSNLVTAGAARTVFIVGEGEGDGESVFTFRRTGTLANLSHWLGGTHYVYSDGVSGASNANITVAAPADATVQNPFISVFKATAGNKIEVALNSIDQVVSQSGFVTTETGATGFTVGNREDATPYGWDGYIAEVLVYNGILSPEEINQTGTYLALRYGIDAQNFNFFFPGPVPLAPEPGTVLLFGVVMALVAGHWWRMRRRG